MGFHDRAATHKTSMRNAKHLEWCKAGGKLALSGLMNHASPSGSPTHEFGFADARRTLPVQMHSANESLVNKKGRRIY